MPRPVLSMTGFGRGQAEHPGGRVVAEVRSLNHRFLEVSVRAPRELLSFDPEARRMVKEKAARGKVEVFLTLERAAEAPFLTPERAAALVRRLGELAALVGDRVRLDHLLAAAQAEGTGEDDAGDGEGKGPALRQAAASALEGALALLLRHRQAEGEVLAADIRSRIAHLLALRGAMVPLADQAPARLARQVADFLAKWDMSSRVDSGRLEAEVALLAQRADITEELTRLATHLAAMEETFSESGGKARGKGDGVGRRLDFLLQEAQREVNTVGSKAGDSSLASLVVEAKSELEKVREQVQNLE